jgi:hypothetical protein
VISVYFGIFGVKFNPEPIIIHPFVFKIFGMTIRPVILIPSVQL